MQMSYCLPAIRTAIIDYPVALTQIQLLGQSLDYTEDFAHNSLVLFPEVIQAGNMYLGYIQNMHGSGRINIMESQELLVLIGFLAGYFSFDNFAENAI